MVRKLLGVFDEHFCIVSTSQRGYSANSDDRFEVDEFEGGGNTMEPNSQNINEKYSSEDHLLKSASINFSTIFVACLA